MSLFNRLIDKSNDKLLTDRFRVASEGGDGGVSLSIIFKSGKVGPFDPGTILNIGQTQSLSQPFCFEQLQSIFEGGLSQTKK